MSFSAPSPTPAISVSVVNWNGGTMVLDCLEALKRQTWRDFEVVVVDNGSTDGSAECIAEAFPAVRMLRQDTNMGFAAANNLAAAAARGTWLALLNNDAFPEPDWLAQLVDATLRHPDSTGFASCQLKYGDTAHLDGAGDAYHAFGIPWREGLGQPYGPPWDQDREILVPCAAAAMYRREAFLDAGGFDETFFCYMEDVDLALRMSLEGHRFRYVPSAVVHHVGSGTKGRTSSFTRYHGHRNLVWTYVKNMPNPLFLRYLPGHLALNLASIVRFWLRGEGPIITRAKWDALKGLPRAWRERRRIQARRTASPESLDRLMAHGWKSLLRESKAR